MPELLPHLQTVWIIFQSIWMSRGTTFGGVWSIPLSEMIISLDLHHVDDPDVRIYYVQLLQKMDETYMDWWMATHGPKEK